MREIYESIGLELLAIVHDPQALKTEWRDDGSTWWIYGQRQARIERTIGNQIVVLVYQNGQKFASFPGLATAPRVVAKSIAHALSEGL